MKPSGEDLGPADRSRDRYRRIAFSAVSLAGARATSLVTLLVTVPLTLDYLGTERFGLWAVLGSLAGLAAIGDFGMGGGVTTAVSQSTGKDDLGAVRRYISSAFVLLCFMGIGLGTLCAVAIPAVDWPSVFNVEGSTARSEITPAITVFAGCAVLGLPLNIVKRVQIGLQRGYVAGAWDTAGAVLGLVGILACVATEAPLPWLIGALIGGPLLAVFLNSVTWWAGHPEIRPSIRFGSRDAGRKLLQLGVLFFVLDLGAATVFATDNLVATIVFDPETAAQYAIPMRLFSLIPLSMGVLLTPMWPAYGEALARGDFGWVRATLWRSIAAILGVGIPVAAGLAIIGPEAIRVWAGPEIEPPSWLFVGLAAWAVITPLGIAVSMFLNGAGVIGLQVAAASAMAVANIALSIALAHAIGLTGIVLATVISFVVFVGIPYSVLVPRTLHALESGQRELAAAPA